MKHIIAFLAAALGAAAANGRCTSINDGDCPVVTTVEWEIPVLRGVGSSTREMSLEMNPSPPIDVNEHSLTRRLSL